MNFLLVTHFLCELCLPALKDADQNSRLINPSNAPINNEDLAIDPDHPRSSHRVIDNYDSLNFNRQQGIDWPPRSSLTNSQDQAMNPDDGAEGGQIDTLDSRHPGMPPISIRMIRHLVLIINLFF